MLTGGIFPENKGGQREVLSGPQLTNGAPDGSG
jgi:hypothetical protein